MVPLSKLFNPKDIKERMDLIAQGREDIKNRFQSMESGDTIPDTELMCDAKLLRYYEAWQKLNQVHQEIAEGVREEDGSVIVRA